MCFRSMSSQAQARQKDTIGRGEVFFCTEQSCWHHGVPIVRLLFRELNLCQVFTTFNRRVLTLDDQTNHCSLSKPALRHIFGLRSNHVPWLLSFYVPLIDGACTEKRSSRSHHVPDLLNAT